MSLHTTGRRLPPAPRPLLPCTCAFPGWGPRERDAPAVVAAHGPLGMLCRWLPFLLCCAPALTALWIRYAFHSRAGVQLPGSRHGGGGAERGGEERAAKRVLFHILPRFIPPRRHPNLIASLPSHVRLTLQEIEQLDPLAPAEIVALNSSVHRSERRADEMRALVIDWGYLTRIGAC